MITKLVLYVLLISGIALVSASLFTAPSKKVVVPVTVVKPPLKKGIVRLYHPEHGTYCSGVVVAPHNIITAAHCVVDEEGALFFPTIEIRDINNEDTGVKAAVDAIFIDRDIAVLKGDFTLFAPLRLASKEEADRQRTPSFPMFSCGFALGLNLLCMPMRYTSHIPHVKGYWVVTNTLMPGMSGGPVILSQLATAPGTQGDVVAAINDAYYPTTDLSELAPISDIITITQGEK